MLQWLLVSDCNLNARQSQNCTRYNIKRISYRQYTESYRHNQTLDQQPKTYGFGIDIRLLFFVSTVRITGMNMSVERQKIAN